MTKLRRV